MPFKNLFNEWYIRNSSRKVRARVLGHLSAEQFQTLSGGYTEEQSRLAKDIPERETAIQKQAMQTIEIHYNDIGCIGGEVPQDKENPRQEITA